MRYETYTLMELYTNFVEFSVEFYLVPLKRFTRFFHSRVAHGLARRLALAIEGCNAHRRRIVCGRQIKNQAKCDCDRDISACAATAPPPAAPPPDTPLPS